MPAEKNETLDSGILNMSRSETCQPLCFVGHVNVTELTELPILKLILDICNSYQTLLSTLSLTSQWILYS